MLQSTARFLRTAHAILYMITSTKSPRFMDKPTSREARLGFPKSTQRQVNAALTSRQDQSMTDCQHHHHSDENTLRCPYTERSVSPHEVCVTRTQSMQCILPWHSRDLIPLVSGHWICRGANTRQRRLDGHLRCGCS